MPLESIQVYYGSKTTESQTLGEFEEAMASGQPFLFSSSLFDLFVSEGVVKEYEALVTGVNEESGFTVSELSRLYCVKVLHEYREELFVEEYKEYQEFCEQYSL